MAHKKGGGSTRNGRDSNAQYRGVKVYGGQSIHSGGIIVRQVGSTFHAGTNVGVGRDFTLFATADGIVKFEREGKKRQRISVYAPGDARLAPAQAAAPRTKKAAPAQTAS